MPRLLPPYSSVTERQGIFQDNAGSSSVEACGRDLPGGPAEAGMEHQHCYASSAGEYSPADTRTKNSVLYQFLRAAIRLLVGRDKQPELAITITIMDEYFMGKTFHALAHLTAHELETLDRELLAEQVKRTLSNPDAVVVEPDAPESVHEQAIQTVLRHKGIKS